VPEGGSGRAEPRPPLLAVAGLTRVVASGRTQVRAVDGVDLHVDAGEITLIMGPSGSGKTTLLSLVGTLLRPTSGRVRIDGVDVTALPPGDLPRLRRETIGFVVQSFNLLETLTAEENVQIALDVAGRTGPEAQARARSLLVEAGLEHRLSFRARDLSGGERQRVALARALANQPRLLLVDEPTANLDSRHGRDVVRLLRDMATHEGCAVLVVSHDPRVIEIADRVLWMEDGRLVEHAPEPAAGVSRTGGRPLAPERDRGVDWRTREVEDGMQRLGVMVRTGTGTYLTVEFDSEDDAHAFRERLHRHERVRAELRTAADSREVVDLYLAPEYDDVQPIVRLS
jgi:putative ABC transport system ATP-binding protein